MKDVEGAVGPKGEESPQLLPRTALSTQAFVLEKSKLNGKEMERIAETEPFTAKDLGVFTLRIDSHRDGNKIPDQVFLLI